MIIELMVLEGIDGIAQEFAAIGYHAQLDIAVAANLFGLDIDLDNACVGGITELRLR